MLGEGVFNRWGCCGRPVLGWVAAIGVLAVVLLGHVVTARAAFSGANGKIAFVSVNGEDSGIYTVNPDGSGETRLSPSPAVDGQPDFSGDGSRIVFSSDRQNATLGREIYVMNADGSGAVDVSNDPAYDADPAFSPDGTKIAFISSRDGTNALWVMNADGSNPHLLSTASWDNGCWSGFPRWSPDGTKIAFQQEYQCSGHSSDHDIFVVNADGSGTPLDVTPNDRADDTLPDWSPDGRKLAYVSTSSGQPTIYTINADGSGTPTQIAYGQRPAFSPDGTQIAYAADGAIYRTSADGSGSPTLVDDLNQDDAPDWQPVHALAPSATTGAATNITSTSATLNGTVNPNGAATSYYFQYGTSTTYTAQTSPQSAGSGTDWQRASAQVSGLTPGVTYHFRIVASSDHGRTFGSDATFTPQAGPAKSAPSATTGPWQQLGWHSVTLTATVNPNGQSTSYHFEWGTSTGYGHSTSSASAGSGTTNSSVSVSLSALLPRTTYHYRIVASNASGTTAGADHVFTTLAPPFAGAFAPAQRDRMARGGTVAVRVGCPGNTYHRCAGKLRLSVFGASIGGGSFVLTPGASARVTVPLSARGRALLRRRGALAAQAQVVSSDGAGTRRSRHGTVMLQAGVTPTFTG